MSFSFIFDMDGTLFQTDTILEPALEETFGQLEKLGLWSGAAPLQQYREIMGVPLPVVWQTLLPEHTSDVREQVDELFLQKLIALIHAGRGELYPYVQDVLSELNTRGHSIYIASNGLVPYLAAIVQHFQLDRWVTETFSIQQIQSDDKTDLVCHIKNIYNMQQGAVIGDRSSDIHAAKHNDLVAIGCRFGFAQEGELSNADHWIDSLEELKSIRIEHND